MLKKLFAVLLCSQLTACITLASSPVATTKFASLESAPRELTILNTTPYLAEMTLALTKNGFSVKQIPSQEIITEQRSPVISSQFKQASTRYGMIFQVNPTRQICAFTDYKIVNVTVNLIDIKTNESVAILKQRGSDGPCTSVTPVFQPLADEIAKLWN